MAHSRQLQQTMSISHSRDSGHAHEYEALDYPIFFGRCKIGTPKMRLSFVRHAVLLHAAELRMLLGHIGESMLRNWEAWEQLVDIRGQGTGQGI